VAHPTVSTRPEQRYGAEIIPFVGVRQTASSLIAARRLRIADMEGSGKVRGIQLEETSAKRRKMTDY
jgi:hypothetical protein